MAIKNSPLVELASNLVAANAVKEVIEELKKSRVKKNLKFAKGLVAQAEKKTIEKVEKIVWKNVNKKGFFDGDGFIMDLEKLKEHAQRQEKM